MTSEMTGSNQPRYLTVNEWCKEKSWPPLGGLRHLIFNAENNGFCHVIRRCGRRVLINEQAFYQWLENQNNKVQSITENDNKKSP